MPNGIHASLVLLTACIAGAGCNLQQVKLPGIPSADELQAEAREEAGQREQFRKTGDLKAARWLLANRVRQGMALEEVNRVLGRGGRRVVTDLRYKSQTEGVRRSDKTYEWQTAEDNIVLFFRKGRLVVHRPANYADADPDSFE